ncbi:MAG: hypothetical protein ACNS60_06445 [Candidatus Cyclobacteriaceae bacterium M2_1C_046]
MDNYLLFFGLLVLILILAGVFFSIREFKEMANRPEEYRTDDEARMDIKK